MFNQWEILLFIGIIVLLFGSARLPSLMRNMGRSLTEFKKGMRGEFDEAEAEAEASTPKKEKID